MPTAASRSASDEFTHLIGARTAAGFGRLVAAKSPMRSRSIPKAACSRRSPPATPGAASPLNWPVDGGGRLPVELSGLPVYDRTRNFAGYRGFGVCRDLDGLARLAALRRYELFSDPPAPQPLSADAVRSADFARPSPSPRFRLQCPMTALICLRRISPATSPQPIWKRRGNLTKSAGYAARTFCRSGPSASRNRAVPDAGRKQRLRRTRPAIVGPARQSDRTGRRPKQPRRLPRLSIRRRQVGSARTGRRATALACARAETPARGESRRDRALLDLLPVGVLIYRLDRLLYANRVFLERMGYASLHALEEAGGLDALYVEPGVPSPPAPRTPARR